MTGTSSPAPAPASIWPRLWHYKLRVLLLFLPWIILLIPLSLLFYNRAEDDLRRPLENKQQEMLQRIEQVLSRSIAPLRRDVRFLAGSDELQRSASGGDIRGLGRLMQQFAEASQQYDQVRWIDASGMERIRVDFRDGHAQLRPHQDLQNKADRYYFRDAIRLKPGEIFLSPLDLNVEHGQLEYPFKPMLRVATPVATANGQAAGVVVLNYLADISLARLKRTIQGSGLELHLLNQEGYWLLSPGSPSPWGFMTGERGQTLAVIAPDLWQSMVLVQEGSAIRQEQRWLYRRLSVQREVLGQVTDGQLLPEESWYLAVAMPLAQIQEQTRTYAVGIGGVTLLLLMLALWASCWLVLASNDREQALATLHAKQVELLETNAGLADALQRLQTMQDELVRVEKLSSLGLMVAGVAHELNTPLGSAVIAVSTLRGRLQVLDSRVEAGELRRSDLADFVKDSREGLELADKALQRSADLVKRFKQLAVDRATSERRTFRLLEVIDDSLHLLRRKPQPGCAEIRLEIPPDIILDSYPGPLGQIVVNLVSNALQHAFEPGDKGNIVVTASETGEHGLVQISVRDNGRGMSRDVAEHAFDPFYTTRRGQGGTGLGLYIVHQLVNDVLGGQIRLHSEPGKGAVFTLNLPRLPRVA